MNVVYHHRTRGKGAEGVHIMGIVKAMRSMGHQVSLLSLPGSDPEAEQQAGAATTPTTQPANTKAPTEAQKGLLHKLMELTRHVPEFVFELIELAYNLVAYVRVGKALRAQQADLLYERYSLFMFAGVLAARRRGIPVILEVNDSAIVERVRPLSFKGLARKLESWIFSKCDGLVFISTAFQDKAKQAYPAIAPSVICPNGADLEQFSLAGVDRDAAKERLGLGDKVVCGYVGAFVYWHGIDWFVEAIAPRLKAQPHLALLLVGDGVVYEPIRDLVEQHQLQEQVLMPGRVPHSEVANYIAAMDYGILPDSNDYGSPMKLFEMMAMSVALVSPSFGPIDEVIEDGENGWLFPPKDKIAAVDRVIALSSDAASIRKVGDQARRYIEEERQWRHNVEQLLELMP